jgi:hypothetical protein
MRSNFCCLIPSLVVTMDFDQEYGDDFEDYNEDFEDEDVSPPPLSAAVAPVAPAKPAVAVSTAYVLRLVVVAVCCFVSPRFMSIELAVNPTHLDSGKLTRNVVPRVAMLKFVQICN